MARKEADPQVTRIEDMLISSTARIGSLNEPRIPDKVQANLRALLRQFADRDIDVFVECANHAMAIYVGLNVLGGGSRKSLLKKMMRLEKTFRKSTDAIFDCEAAEFELVLRFAKGRPIDRALDDVPPSYERPGQLAKDLTGLSASAGGVADMLRGTAQDGTRPLRQFVSSLHDAWLSNGWPTPKWRGDIDPRDPEEPDDDLFCEVVRFLLEWLGDVRTKSGEVLSLRPGTSPIQNALRELILGQKKL